MRRPHRAPNPPPRRSPQIRCTHPHKPLVSNIVFSARYTAAARLPALTRARGFARGRWQVLMQAFTLTFLAEWGDRSQIATIALAAAREPFGVTLGGCIGHACCTAMAVVGGKLLASSISERKVLLAGGVCFVVFAVLALFGIGD